MAIVLTDDLAFSLSDLKGRSYNDLYATVVLADDSLRTVRLTDLLDNFSRKFFDDVETPDAVATFDRLEAGLLDRSLRAHIKLNDRTIAVKSISKPVMISTVGISTELTDLRAKLAYGMKQSIGVFSVETPNYSEDTKVFIKLHGDNDFQLVNAKDVYVFANGISTKLSELRDATILNAIVTGSQLDNVRLIYANRDIDVLDKSKFIQNAVIDQESYAVGMVDGRQVMLHRDIDSDYEYVDDDVVTRSFKAEKNGERYIESRNYTVEPTRNGDHIHVTDKQNRQHFVAIADLYTGTKSAPVPVDATIFATDFLTDPTNNYLQYVGESLLLREGDNFIELAPLTADQAIKVYKNTTYAPTHTNDPSLIAKPGTYRQTVDGRFFEESKIQPICYDYADSDADFTDYLFNVSLPTGFQTVIVPRKQFVSRANIQIQVDGNLVNLSLTGSARPRPLKRTSKQANRCAVVQTTTTHGSIFNKAVVIKTNNSADEVNTDVVQQTYSNFVEKYRAGEYVVNDTFDDAGNLVEFKQTSSRYIMTDYVRMPDYADKNAYYNNFEDAKLSLKNGKFQGSATFNGQKASKKYKSSALKVASTSMKLMVTPLGFLTALVFPALPLVAVASVASIPVARLVNAVRTNASKFSLNRSLKSPLQINRTKAEKTLFNELQTMFDDVTNEWQTCKKQAEKTYGKGASYQLTDSQIEIIQQKFLELEQKFNLSFAKEDVSGELHVVDGSAKITGQNAYLARRYEQMLADKDKQIAKLKRRVRFARGEQKVALQAELDELVALRENMTKEFLLTHDELPESKQAQQDAKEFLTLAKGLIVAKYVQNKEPEWTDDLTKLTLKSLKVDFGKRKIKYKGKTFNSVEELCNKHPEIQPVIDKLVSASAIATTTEHKDINGNPIVNPEDIERETEVEHTEEVTTEVEHTTSTGAELDTDTELTPTTEEAESELTPTATAPETSHEEISEEVAVPPLSTDLDLIGKLTERLETAKQTQQDINSRLEHEFDEIKALLEKDNLTEAEQQKVIDYIDDLATKAVELKTSVDELNKDVETVSSSTEDNKTLLETITKNIQQFEQNISSCATNVEKLKILLNKKMSEDKTASVVEKIDSLQTIIAGYQSQINDLSIQIASHLKALVENEKDVESYTAEIESLKAQLEQTKSQLEQIQVQDKATIDMLNQQIDGLSTESEALKQQLNNCAQDVKTANAARQNIIESASETIELIDDILTNYTIDMSRFDALKAKAIAGQLFGLKTAISDETATVVNVKSQIERQISLVQTRIASLEQMQQDIADVDSDELNAVKVKAKEKIMQLKRKQEKLNDVLNYAKLAYQKYSTLKVFVDILKIKQDAEKVVTEKQFASKLTPSEKDIKFLAKVINNYKNLYKLDKVIAGFEQINPNGEYDIDSVQANVATLMVNIQSFIKNNYNVFNECTDENVRNKYYLKVSTYSIYDHSVVFMMPSGNQTDGSLNV